MYGYWYSHQANADTWSFHEGGLAEYQLLMTDPVHYFTNLFRTDYPRGWANIFANENSDWNDLKTDLMAKLLALMNIPSFGHYYVNVVLYSFITFFGFIYLYKALTTFYGGLTKLATLFLFLTPSCLFWTSGIHKDGFVLLLIGLILYQLSKILISEISHLKAVLVLLASLLLLFVFRSYVAIGIVPAVIAVGICHIRKTAPHRIFLPVYGICITFFFLSRLGSSTSLPEKIVAIREDFQKMTGGSKLDQSDLEPGVGSFLMHLPEAIDHAILRPYLWQATTIPQIIAGTEVLVFIVFALIACFFLTGLRNNPFNWFLIAFTSSVLLFIGYIVAFSGAIVRYRAIFVMLILVLTIQHLNYPKLREFFKRRKPLKREVVTDEL